MSRHSGAAPQPTFAPPKLSMLSKPESKPERRSMLAVLASAIEARRLLWLLARGPTDADDCSRMLTALWRKDSADEWRDATLIWPTATDEPLSCTKSRFCVSTPRGMMAGRQQR